MLFHVHVLIATKEPSCFNWSTTISEVSFVFMGQTQSLEPPQGGQGSRLEVKKYELESETEASGNVYFKEEVTMLV